MATTVRVPKRVSIEDLRRAIGDKATEAALTALFGPKMLSTTGSPLRIEQGTFERMLAMTEGKQLEGVQLIPAAIRLYWRESPHARARFAFWLRSKIAEVEAFNKGEIKEIGGDLWVLKAASPTVHAPRKRKNHPEPREHLPTGPVAVK